jgi:hypothetical protein
MCTQLPLCFSIFDFVKCSCSLFGEPTFCGFAKNFEMCSKNVKGEEENQFQLEEQIEVKLEESHRGISKFVQMRRRFYSTNFPFSTRCFRAGCKPSTSWNRGTMQDERKASNCFDVSLQPLLQRQLLLYCCSFIDQNQSTTWQSHESIQLLRASFLLLSCKQETFFYLS